jgi:hypothetical protein
VTDPIDAHHYNANPGFPGLSNNHYSFALLSKKLRPDQCSVSSLGRYNQRGGQANNQTGGNATWQPDSVGRAHKNRKYIDIYFNGII